MALVSPDGRFLRANRSLCDIVGYPADELVMKAFQDITHPDDLDADLGYEPEELVGRSYYDLLDPGEIDPAVVQEAHQRVLSRTQPGATVVLAGLRKKDGTTGVFEATSQAVTDPESGAIVEIRAAAREVTKRGRAERALRQSEERVRRPIETCTEAFVAMDADGLITDGKHQ